MKCRVYAVEEADLLWGERLAEARCGEIGNHRLAQAVVLGIDGVLIGGDGADCLHHLRTGPHGVLIEVEPKQAPAALKRSAVGLEALNLGARLGKAWNQHRTTRRIITISNGLLSRQSKRDDFTAFLAGRVVKLAANAMRPLFYLHYWLLPKQRFQLANSRAKSVDSAQTINSNSRPNAGPVPKIIWQTNYTNKVSLPIKTAWCWNRLLSISYQYCFHSTEDRLAFVEQNFPGKPTELYNRLTIGAAQADVWRLMVLYKHGGVYMDIDSHFIWPLDRFIEAGTSEIFLRYKSKDATNYFIASAPTNPNIKALLDEVLYRIETSQSNNVYDITGPSVFQDVLAERSHTWRLSQHTCLQGNFSNKFFQYLDKPQGCWTQEQKLRRVVQPEQGRQ